MALMGVNCCSLWALLGSPVPYADLVLSHQIRGFLKTVPSHFLNSCVKGFMYCWFQSFLLPGLVGKKPALLWNVGVTSEGLHLTNLSYTWKKELFIYQSEKVHSESMKGEEQSSLVGTLFSHLLRSALIHHLLKLFLMTTLGKEYFTQRPRTHSYTYT